MWIILSLIAAAGDSFRDSASKRFSGKTPALLVSWSYTLFALPFFIPHLIGERPANLPDFYWPLLWCVTSLHTVGCLIIVETLKAGELSLSIPLSAFTPVFLLILAPILTGDTVTPAGIAGALLVVSGSYLLNLSYAKHGVLAPIRALVNQPGARGMLFMSFLWSITGSIDRIAVRSIPINFWAASQVAAISAMMFPIVLLRGQLLKLFKPRIFVKLFLIGACNTISFIPYLTALTVAPAHFVVCVKRTSILFSIVLGKIIFKEGNLRERFAGAMIMLLGVIVIALRR